MKSIFVVRFETCGLDPYPDLGLRASKQGIVIFVEACSAL